MEVKAEPGEPAEPTEEYAEPAPKRKAVKIKHPVEKIQEAVMAVMQKRMSQRQASVHFGIPRRTLRDRLCGRSLEEDGRQYNRAISSADENAIVEYISHLQALGCELNCTEIRSLGSHLARDKGRLEDNMLSHSWYRRFKDRVPHVRKGSRKMITDEIKNRYYAHLSALMEEHGLTNAPHRIFSMDERSISADPQTGKIVIESSYREACGIENLTQGAMFASVIICGNATGTLLNPFIIFRAQSLAKDMKESCSTGAQIAHSKDGYCDRRLFCAFLEHHFLPLLSATLESGPILLLYDGHALHIGPDTVEFARRRNVILFVTPPHSDHSVDEGYYGQFRELLAQKCLQHMKDHPQSSITKAELGKHICEAYQQGFSVSKIKQSFRDAGICPLQSSRLLLVNDAADN